MKIFKKIPIKGFENYEINQSGYILMPDGTLSAMDMSDLIGGVRVGELIAKLFENE